MSSNKIFRKNIYICVVVYNNNSFKVLSLYNSITHSDSESDDDFHNDTHSEDSDNDTHSEDSVNDEPKDYPFKNLEDNSDNDSDSDNDRKRQKLE